MVEVLVKSLTCPKCGAALTVRGGDHTLSVVCDHCHSILDAKDPNLKILQTFAARQLALLRIPLGTRGAWRGAEYEVIGYQVRTIRVDETNYSWSEYLLFNPYQGFRYLTEYDGHWNDVIVLKSLPTVERSGGRPIATVLGERFRHFQTATATTSYVLGEFPWQVRVGESAEVSDYIDPPRVLSEEKTKDETTWSMGEYVTGERVWEAFRLPGLPPEPRGVYENQPAPAGPATRVIWRTWALLSAAVLVLALLRYGFSPRPVVFQGSFELVPPTTPPTDSQLLAAAFVTDTFRVGGRTSNLELRTESDLGNNWLFLGLALINDSSGAAYDFGRELSYYYGTDSDGFWSEGSQSDRALIPSIPPGRYYLRIQPETQPGGAYRAVRYRLRLRRDVPWGTAYVAALLLLLVPPAGLGWRNASFEHQRWQESDYAETEDDE